MNDRFDDEGPQQPEPQNEPTTFQVSEFSNKTMRCSAPDPTVKIVPHTPEAAGLPAWKSKDGTVQAVKIASVVPRLSEGGAWFVPEGGIDKFSVSQHYMEKHLPEAGGYYVKYEDGCDSWITAESFESDYSLTMPA